MKNLKHYGGNGYYGLKENGNYIVKYADKEVKFNNLTQARDLYFSLNETKALWDVTYFPELIDCHTKYE